MTARIFGIAGSTNSAEDFRLSAGGLFVPASAINDRSGVTSVPTLTGTGSLTANVGPFSCLIDGTSNSLQGSYWVAQDAATGITIGTGSSQARIDLISMQIQDNAYDGSGFQRAQLVVTAGTPSGSPAVPAAPANSISLWTLPVPALASSVTFSTATAVFPYTATVGGIVPVRNATDQPAAANGVQYRHRLDVTAAAGSTSPLESSTDGTTWTSVYSPPGAWTPYTPVWTSSGTAPATVNGSLVGFYAKVGRLVTAKIAMYSGSSTTFGTGYYSFSLPFPAAVTSVPAGLFAHTGRWVLSASASAYYGNIATILQSTPGVVNGVADGSGSFFGATIPATWVASTSTFFICTITYESTT